MGLFKSKDSALLGIDISSTAIKLLELSRSGQRYRVEAYSAVPLQEGAVTDGQIVDVTAVGTALAEAVQKAKTSTKETAVAVSGSAVITKVITMLAGQSDSELEQQVLVEADQHIPYPVEEVHLDFEVLGPNQNDNTLVDVLLAASRSENVESRIAALEHAGLKPKIIDIEAYAMENACALLKHQIPEGGAGKTVALVDMGASQTSFTVLHDLRAVYTRDQSFGGRQLTEDIMERYSLSWAEAGKAKKIGGLPEDYQEAVYQPFMSGLVQMIDRSLQLFYSANPSQGHVDQILLAGGCALMEGLVETISTELQTPVAIANPFAKMDINRRANPKRLQRDIPAMLIACGLAMRSFD